MFKTHAEYEAYINSDEALLSNVCFCEDNYEVHYNPYREPIVAKFDVTDTTTSTKIISNELGDEVDYFSTIEIDGVRQASVENTYQFNTIGEHTVKYTLVNPTIIGTKAFMRCPYLTSVTIPNSVTIIGNESFGSCI